MSFEGETLEDKSLGEKLKEVVQEDARFDTKILEEEKREIERQLSEKAVIDTDPKQTKELEKRLAVINAELAQIYGEKQTEQVEVSTQPDDIALSDEDKAIEERDAIIDEDESVIDDGDESIVAPVTDDMLDKDETEEKVADDPEILKENYYKALVALYDKKKETVSKQIASGEFVSSQEDYDEEVRLEIELYTARDKYMALGEEDPYTKKRTELIEEDKEAREPIETELRNRAKEYREIEDKIRQLNEEEQDLNEKMMKPDITPAEIENIQMRLQQIGSEKRDLEVERARILPALQKAVDIRQQRALERSALEHKFVETLGEEDLRNYNYQQDKIDVMNNNVEQANKQNYQNIESRITEREKKIKDICKELKELSDSEDFDRRLFLLDQLDRETNMLEADRQAKSDLDKDVSLTSEEATIVAEDKFKGEQERQEDFSQVTGEARAAVEAVEADREDVSASAFGSDSEVQSQKREDKLEAVATAAIIADTPEEMVGTYVGARVVQKVAEASDPFRAQLSGMTTDVEDPKQAAEYLDKVKEADERLDVVTRDVTERVESRM